MLSLFLFSVQSVLLSIDLGDESMRVSQLKRGNPVTIVLTGEGRRFTSSVASIIPTDDSAPAIVTEEESIHFHRSVGDLSLAQRYPMNSARFLPLILGKNYSGKLVNRLLRQNLSMPYDSGEDKSLELICPPEFFAAQLIQSAIKNCKDAKVNQTVDYLNLVVPKFWTHHQRKALLRSAHLATYKGHITENTAAIATLFSIEKSQLFKKEPIYVMFIDIGAHQIQVSIMEFDGSHEEILVEEVGYAFNDEKGGYTIDTTIARAIRRQLLKQKPNANITERAVQKFIAGARKVKHELTLQKKVSIFLEDLLPGFDMTFTMTQDNLKKAASPELRALNETLWQAMDAAGFSSHEDLDRIELIGGGSRMPIVTDLLNEIFDSKVPIMHSLNAEEASVVGASYYEANRRPGFLSQEIHFKPYPLYNITSSYVSKSLAGKVAKSDKANEEEKIPDDPEDENLEESETHAVKNSDKKSGKKSEKNSRKNEIKSDRFVTYEYTPKKGDRLHLPMGVKSFIATFDRGTKGNPEILDGIVHARGCRRMTHSGLYKERSYSVLHLMQAFEKREKTNAEQDKRLHEYETYLLDTREKLTKDEDVLSVTTSEERSEALKIIANQQYYLAGEERNEISETKIGEMRRELDDVAQNLLKRGEDHKEAPELFRALKTMLEQVTKAVLEDWPAQGVRPKRAHQKGLGKICSKVDKYLSTHEDIADVNAADVKILLEKLKKGFEITRGGLKLIHHHDL